MKREQIEAFKFFAKGPKSLEEREKMTAEDERKEDRYISLAMDSIPEFLQEREEMIEELKAAVIFFSCPTTTRTEKLEIAQSIASVLARAEGEGKP